ncbi:MAG: peptide chain release factor 2 [Caldisericia bacterium]
MVRPRSFFDHLIPKRDELQEELEKPEIWSDPEKASKLNKELTFIKGRLGEVEDVKKILDESDVLLEFSKEEDSSIADLRDSIDKANNLLESIELKNLMSGRFDQGNAFLSFSAGAGGVDAQDWTEMLIRMYTRWATEHGYSVKVTDQSVGDESGIKSATLYIEGEYAFGFLKSEKGVHRLVRISPFDSNHRRHTSFSYVEVLPEIAPAEQITIDPKDLRIDVFNASGHGGQNVQKNATAVRITHLPTKTVVACQNERSQLMNKNMAMKVLQSRLQKLEDEKQAEKEKDLRGPRVSIEWGNQIRSYVLQPYTIVKDNRTGVEIGNVTKVLEGDLDALIWGYLKWKAKEEAS